MIVLAILFGALGGALFAGFAGAAMGALLGYGLWETLSLRKRLSLLERDVEGLRSRLTLPSVETAVEQHGGEEAPAPRPHSRRV